MKNLKKKTVLVVGAASGIGRSCAVEAIAAGANVIISDRNTLALASLERELKKNKENSVTAFVTDVEDMDQIRALMGYVDGNYKRLDAAINCAGISSDAGGASGRMHEIDLNAWNKLIDINLTGTWRCMREQIHCMLGTLKKDIPPDPAPYGPAIVNIASVAGLTGLKNSSAYVAAKHGVVGLTKAAAMDLGSEGIRINAICPGFIDTPLIRNIRSKLGDAALMKVNPMGRLGSPGEVARLAIWLCSDAASFVTGACYTVDGGMTAGHL